jgi:hypothetical protein
MKLTIALAAAAAFVSSAASAQGAGLEQFKFFTGDTRLSCEAIMCLASSAGRGEAACQPSLRRYFSINHRRLRDTVRARRNFLDICPTGNENMAGMDKLKAALSAGAGQCDAAALNSVLATAYDYWSGSANVQISNVMPSYCSALYGDPNTDFQKTGLMPRYVGVPERGGLWAEPQDYERLLAEYTARVAAEDAERARNGWWWN